MVSRPSSPLYVIARADDNPAVIILNPNIGDKSLLIV
jgi:hypothetical protein